MGRIAGRFIFPHPPIMVEAVGKGEAKKVQDTIDAANEAARRIKELRPDTVILITPHAALFRDAMCITADERLEGSLERFGAPQVRLELDNDLELVDRIVEEAEAKGVYCVPMNEDVKSTYGVDKGLDHGTIVPLNFVAGEYRDFRLVHINYSLLTRDQHYKFGIAIRAAVSSVDRSVVVIASSDLSHRLTKDAPAGYNEKGKDFDRKYVECIKNGDTGEFLAMSPEFLEAAGECGYNSTLVLLGTLDKCKARADILSYEGPFGVGYCIAQVFEEGCGEKTMKKSDDPLVKLAVETLESYVREGRKEELPADLPEEMLKTRAGVFVSLKKYGELRGCIGTIKPTTGSIAEEIMQNAISAGTEDPRFEPVTADELDDITYSVDVLGKPEPVTSKAELDVKHYGVIVRSGHKTGLLLPNLEGVDTVEEQLDIVLRKAGIGSRENYTMERFEVVRHY